MRGLTFLGYRALKELLLISGAEHVIEVNGYKLITIPNDAGISTELQIFKTHEPLSTEVLKTELKDGMICLDIGANIGYYTLLERALVGGNGKVIALEPSPLTYSYLNKNIELNRSIDVETFNLAFSSSNCEIPFLVGAMSNLSRVANMDDGYSESSIIKVEARTLDSFVSNHHIEKLDFLRMDVEGHENAIIQGGLLTIKRFKPILHVEIHTSLLGSKETVFFLHKLQDLGYNVKYYIPRELDIPFIGSKQDIQKLDFDDVIKKLSERKLPDTFHLLLVNN